MKLPPLGKGVLLYDVEYITASGFLLTKMGTFQLPVSFPDTGFVFK